ncbi:pyridoxamine 5'-phosphate oxidase [Marinifilum sp. D714]|uniref:pyridoxamine 5'-phosphate oxidase n=1 Tax=Marinifilum sp. D714 TaxID=2937523 RepID=UPI0027C580C2|nr:pyridoxamine 5'-phosphate oxidase [Marinifilum sp. D714]MDQ2177285.1 pyridoxamine 5'-phosphate oxidase [Marinifilum sp. D714]
MKEDFKKIRHEYNQKELRKKDMHEDPFVQFEHWFKNALEHQIPDANAMTLSTVSKVGRPSGRILLLKDFNEKGFCFFTNYKSRKGDDLKHNPYASMVFFWPELEQQIRIEGKIEKVDLAKSNEYFYDRPVGSRIAAAISPQSQKIKNRAFLDNLYSDFKNKHEGDFPKPDFWGGYILIPDLFEFWQGRSNRLNDRIEYFLENSHWKTRRLAP